MAEELLPLDVAINNLANDLADYAADCATVDDYDQGAMYAEVVRRVSTLLYTYFAPMITLTRR